MRPASLARATSPRRRGRSAILARVAMHGRAKPIRRKLSFCAQSVERWTDVLRSVLSLPQQSSVGRCGLRFRYDPARVRVIAVRRPCRRQRRRLSMNWSRAASVSARMKPADRWNVWRHNSLPMRVAVTAAPTEAVTTSAPLADHPPTALRRRKRCCSPRAEEVPIRKLDHASRTILRWGSR